MVLKHESIILDVLGWIIQESRLILVPLLEPWLLRHAQNVDEGEGGEEQTVERIGVEGDREDCTFMFLRRGSYKVFDYIYSIAEVTQGNEESEGDFPPCGQDLSLLGDIRDSLPDTWWLFPADDYGIAIDENQWTLVNYQQKKIYSGPTASSGYTWIDGVWDPRNWKKST